MRPLRGHGYFLELVGKRGPSPLWWLLAIGIALGAFGSIAEVLR